MKPLVLIVEDHPKILLNIKLILEFNEYEVITAINGKKALEILYKLETPPDVIISDIMMPEINGYDLFAKVSENPDWFDVPFIFLTAKSDPEDVRLGKMLGVDDYITKPFEKDDLLASIAGKLTKKKKSKKITERIGEVLNKLDIQIPSKLDKEEVHLIIVFWDEEEGPIIEANFPETDVSFSMVNLGIQLFQTTVSIYGDTRFREAQGVLLNITNIKRDGYLFFDTIEDPNVRGGEKQFMLASIAPNINYFNSLRIKELFLDIAAQIKIGDWNNSSVKNYWEKITDILAKPLSPFY